MLDSRYVWGLDTSDTTDSLVSYTRSYLDDLLQVPLWAFKMVRMETSISYLQEFLIIKLISHS